VCCRMLQCAAVCCSVLPYVAVCCRILQCAAVCCSVLPYVAVCCRMLQCVAVCCSVLPYVEVCCSALQCVSICCRMFPLFPWVTVHARCTHRTPTHHKTSCARVAQRWFVYTIQGYFWREQPYNLGHILRTHTLCIVHDANSSWYRTRYEHT